MEYKKAIKIIDGEFKKIIKEEKILKSECDAVSKDLENTTTGFNKKMVKHGLLTKKYIDLYLELIKEIKKIFKQVPPNEKRKVVLYLRGKFNEIKGLRKFMFDYSKKCIEKINSLGRTDYFAFLAVLDAGLMWRRTTDNQFFDAVNHKALRSRGYRDITYFAADLNATNMGSGNFIFLVKTKNIKKLWGDSKEIRVYQEIPASEWEAIYVLDKNILEQARIIAKKHRIKCSVKYNPSEMRRINQSLKAKETKYFKHNVVKYKEIMRKDDITLLKEYKYSDELLKLMIYWNNDEEAWEKFS